jgi:hypothetical protein
MNTVELLLCSFRPSAGFVALRQIFVHRRNGGNSARPAGALIKFSLLLRLQSDFVAAHEPPRTVSVRSTLAC